MSTLNKNLVKPSDISWMDKARGNRTKSIAMKFGLSVADGISYLGWKQNGYVGSYQVQYKVTGRLTPEEQFSKGASTTVTDWKYPYSDWVGDVDKLNKGVKADSGNVYYLGANFKKCIFMTPKLCDKFSIRVRVRPFNIAKKTHGEWVYETLTVYCVPQPKVHKVVALANGGLRVYLDMDGWTRGGTNVFFKDVRHVDGTNAMAKNEVYDVMNGIGDAKAGNYPYVTLNGKYLKESFYADETVVFKDVFVKTCDGEAVSINGSYKIDSVISTIDNPTITIKKDANNHAISVSLAKYSPNVQWDDVAVGMVYISSKGTGSVLEVAKTDGANGSSTWLFQPPLDSELQVWVSIKNKLGGDFYKWYTSRDFSALDKIVSGGRAVINYTRGYDVQPDNGLFYGSSVVELLYDVQYNLTTKKQVEKELPWGRSKPVAFLRDGVETSISLSGSIGSVADSEFNLTVNSNIRMWHQFREHQGMVFLRLPDGEFFTAVCTSVSMSPEDEYDEIRQISLSLEEVDV